MLLLCAFLGDPECFAVISVNPFSLLMSKWMLCGCLCSKGHLPELGARQLLY